MAVSLHGINQHGDQHLQALAANPIRGFPQNCQGLYHCLVVHPVALPYLGTWTSLAAQHADRVLAVVAGQGHEFVEDLDPISGRRAAISQPQCLDQFLACRHADLPCHDVLPPPGHPAGNKLREATGQHG